MNLTRRAFTVGSLLAAGTAGMPVFVRAEGSKTVALLFDSLVSPFWVSGIEIMRQKAKAKGWTTLENISNFDDNKQFEQVKAMIARKVDGILIIQTDAKAVIPAIRAANAANIPMVHFNRPPAKSDAYSVAIQADNRKIMQNTVQFLVDEAKQKGGSYKACILIGDLGDVNAIQRRDGFFDIVNQHKDMIEVVARVATEWNADKAFAGLTNALQANPDINFLVTSSDFMHPQIEQVLKSPTSGTSAAIPGMCCSAASTAMRGRISAWSTAISMPAACRTCSWRWTWHSARSRISGQARSRPSCCSIPASSSPRQTLTRSATRCGATPSGRSSTPAETAHRSGRRRR